jgi:hypothetical protein
LAYKISEQLLDAVVLPARREYCSTKREKDDQSMEQEGVEWNELRAGGLPTLLDPTTGCLQFGVGAATAGF